MKQIVRYRFMTIPNKLHADIRLTVDDDSRAELKSTYEGGKSTNLVLLPMINLQIVKPLESDANGRRFRPLPQLNDSIGLTKFNLPTFIMELKAIFNDMKTPDLYTYRGDRLDINEGLADKVRRAFIIGRTSIELRPIIIEQPNETGAIDRIEGIKMKFNNESSIVYLTLREVESILWTFNHLDIDNLILNMYLSFIDRSSTSSYERSKPVVDIVPKPTYKQTTSVSFSTLSEIPTISDIPSNITVTEEKPMKTKESEPEVSVNIPAEAHVISNDEPEEIDFDQAEVPPEVAASIEVQ